MCVVCVRVTARSCVLYQGCCSCVIAESESLSVIMCSHFYLSNCSNMLFVSKSFPSYVVCLQICYSHILFPFIATVVLCCSSIAVGRIHISHRVSSVNYCGRWVTVGSSSSVFNNNATLFIHHTTSGLLPR